MESKLIISMDGKKTRIINRRIPSANESIDQGKERVHKSIYLKCGHERGSWKMCIGMYSSMCLRV